MSCIEKIDGINCPNPVRQGEKLCIFHKNAKNKWHKKASEYLIGGAIIGFFSSRMFPNKPKS